VATRGAADFATPLELGAAVRLLVEGSGLDADDDVTRAIAEAMGREAAALEWAASLARTRGWRPLREKLATWPSFATLVRSALPWQASVDAAIGRLGADAVAALEKLAACDASMTWELIEQRLGVDAITIETLCDLEDAALVRRTSRAGVVSFVVPFCVRASLRIAKPEAMEHEVAAWVMAWRARAEELAPSLYGSSARATLVELAGSLPMIERALLSCSPAEPAAGEAARAWAAVSDAMFFEGSIDYASGAFGRAVVAADADARGDVTTRVRARLATARALLERGMPEEAEALLAEARDLAEGSGDALASEALRGSGWAAAASARLDDAKDSFAKAHALAEHSGHARSRADAIAGLGMVALLQGDASAAREKLTDALAIHVVARDAPREAAVKGMMMLLPESRTSDADVAALVKDVESLRGAGQRWREALALGRLALVARERGDDDAAKSRLAEARAAASLAEMAASPIALAMVDTSSSSRGSAAAGSAAPANAITVGAEGRSLLLPNGTRHELARHGPVRRVLLALAIARRERPGVAMSTLDVVEAGWPGEKMRHEAATLRVYTTVRRLRALGLGDVLLTRDDGYLLDPDASLVILQHD